MKLPMFNTLVFIGTCMLLAACTDKTTEPAPALPVQDSNAKASPAEQWLGQWNGPEGTFLRLEQEGGDYKVTIQNLDGPRSFAGRADGETIKFERDGVQETIHATNGAETGMKWLSEKANCLTIRSGEGYCRD